jgi:hypothetical protein
MILLPKMIQEAALPAGLDAALFPLLDMQAPDVAQDEPVDSPRRVAARAAIERLERETRNITTSSPSDFSTSAMFSEMHPVFGAHMATRTTAVPAGGVVVGAVHKYPTLNILLRGKVLMVSEHGRRMLVAPCMYMQEANVKKAGLVLEDCELTNVLLMPQAYDKQDEAEQAVRAFHTAPKYSDVGRLADSPAPALTKG